MMRLHKYQREHELEKGMQRGVEEKALCASKLFFPHSNAYFSEWTKSRRIPQHLKSMFVTGLKSNSRDSSSSCWLYHETQNKVQWQYGNGLKKILSVLLLCLCFTLLVTGFAN